MKMRLWIMIVFLGACFFVSATYGDAEHKIYQFATAAQAQQFKTLTWEMRCLVCQNQNLAESDATLAADFRQQIAEKIKAGQSNQTIIEYFVSRYGDYIMYKPPVIKSTWLLWFGPFVLLGLALMVLWAIVKFSKQNHKKAQGLTEEEEMKLQQLLSNSDS